MKLPVGKRLPHERLIPIWILLLTVGFWLGACLSAHAAAWLTNSPLNIARQSHTATLLQNGKVLVVGGAGTGFNSLSSAELYDPGSGKWVVTGALIVGRYNHTATLLPNGKVLVSGGWGNTGLLASAELYDPGTEQWAQTGALHARREEHTAVVLSDGRVVVAGGDESWSGSQVEVYDPATGTWTATALMKDSVAQHTANLLPNGKVLVAGGYGYSSALRNAELYDPTTDTWVDTGALNAGRSFHTLTLLPNGLAIALGGRSDFNYLPSAELYDPASGVWINTGSLAVGRYAHTATLLSNGRLLVAGGWGTNTWLGSAELYDLSSGTWTFTASMNVPRDFHTATSLPNGKVLVAGGEGNGDVLSSTEVYDPIANTLAGTWSNVNSMNSVGYIEATLLTNALVLVVGGWPTPEVYDPEPGTWATVGAPTVVSPSEHTLTLLPDGRVLLAGGYRNNTFWPNADLFNPLTRTWTPTGPMAEGRFQHTATLLPNGKVLVAGGGNGSYIPTSLTGAELYDPARGSWTATGRLNTARRGHTSTLLANGEVLVTGGVINGSSRLSSAELYDLATGSWAQTGSMLTARNVHTATLLPNGKVLVAGGLNYPTTLASAELYDPVTGTWAPTGALNFARKEHSATLLLDGRVLVAGGDGISSAELYDPATGKWAVAAQMNRTHRGHIAVLLTNGDILVAGGGPTDATAETYRLKFESGGLPPQIGSITSPLTLGGYLVASGDHFRSQTEGSSGNTRSSPGDHPLVQLRSIESAQTTFLPAISWGQTSFSSGAVWQFPPGWALATVFVNGVRSASRIVNISVPVPSEVRMANPVTPARGSFQFEFTNSPGACFGSLVTTNLAIPLSGWKLEGGVVEISPGQFQFTDPNTTNIPQRFYRIRSL